MLMPPEDFEREVVSLTEESVTLAKHVVETGNVRIRTVVDHEDLVLRDTIARGLIDVERVAIDRAVDVAPVVREDGEWLIVPVVEERLVVHKQLVLVEELRIRRSTVTVPVDVPVTRRIMRAVIERDDLVAHPPEETRT